ncbi:hypothetical protein Cadr_000005137 [Camelus dromedarius]|uniref:Uncharacterized protein n=1 Tax=Camelus dromedarius TaxID=9838 RepID=A0A5N4E3J7_CAMDR|nr:hypothetical protein Cadr_000005137 [Camelus dromedarius]
MRGPTWTAAGTKDSKKKEILHQELALSPRLSPHQTAHSAHLAGSHSALGCVVQLFSGSTAMTGQRPQVQFLTPPPTWNPARLQPPALGPGNSGAPPFSDAHRMDLGPHKLSLCWSQGTVSSGGRASANLPPWRLAGLTPRGASLHASLGSFMPPGGAQFSAPRTGLAALPRRGGWVSEDSQKGGTYSLHVSVTWFQWKDATALQALEGDRGGCLSTGQRSAGCPQHPAAAPGPRVVSGPRPSQQDALLERNQGEGTRLDRQPGRRADATTGRAPEHKDVCGEDAGPLRPRPHLPLFKVFRIETDRGEARTGHARAKLDFGAVMPSCCARGRRGTGTVQAQWGIASCWTWPGTRPGQAGCFDQTQRQQRRSAPGAALVLSPLRPGFSSSLLPSPGCINSHTPSSSRGRKAGHFCQKGAKGAAPTARPDWNQAREEASLFIQDSAAGTATLAAPSPSWARPPARGGRGGEQHPGLQVAPSRTDHVKRSPERI